MPTPRPQQAPMTSTVSIMTMELMSSSVASSKLLVQSSTLLEASVIATDSVLATSTRVESHVETETAQ
jgi:hypothetical protein